MARTKIAVPQYEDHEYLFFTIKHRTGDGIWSDSVTTEIILGDREIYTYNSRVQIVGTDYAFPTQEYLNSKAEATIFDKLHALFNNQYAEKDHEHSFVAR